MIVRLPKDFQSVILQNNGLRQYLNNLLVGKEFTPRSWLYENQQPDTILKNWLDILSQLESGSPEEVNVYQFDTSQLEKWGPQGGVKPISELMDVVQAGFKDDSPRPSAFTDPDWKKAKKTVTQQFARLRLSLRPAAYHKVVDDMRARDTLESNSGWPLFTRRNKPEVIKQAIEAAHDGQWKTYPAIALFRNYNQKTRLVWMFPMATNLKEGSYFQPLQSALINRYRLLTRTLRSGVVHDPIIGPLAPWIGFAEVQKKVTFYYDKFADTIAASDFSQTDEHFTHWHSEEVCDVIETCFQPEYRAGLRESILAMHEIPLIIGPDQMVTGQHGLASGSNWTNFIETIFDILFGFYVYYKTGYDHNLLYAIGDDCAWSAEEYDDAFGEKLEQLGKEVGHIIKADKTTNFEDRVKSLQRLFQRGYNTKSGQTRAVYSTVRALKSSVYPERFHNPKDWNSDMFCARQYMILENCVDHPLFKDFVQFVVRGQKDLIPFAKKSAAELDKITRESKLIPGLNPTYNQEKRDQSLGSFASIQLARDL